MVRSIGIWNDLRREPPRPIEMSRRRLPVFCYSFHFCYSVGHLKNFKVAKILTVDWKRSDKTEVGSFIAKEQEVWMPWDGLFIVCLMKSGTCYATRMYIATRATMMRAYGLRFPTVSFITNQERLTLGASLFSPDIRQPFLSHSLLTALISINNHTCFSFQNCL